MTFNSTTLHKATGTALLMFFWALSLIAQQNVELKLQKGHTDKINEILFTPSGKRLISCSDDNTIKIWDVKSGKELRTLVGHQFPVNYIAINDQGTKVFSGGDKREKKVIIWDAVTGEKLSEVEGFEGSIEKISFSQYGGRIAVLESLPGFETRVSIWDETLGTKRFDLKLPTDFSVRAIAFHPAINHIAVGGRYLKKEKEKSVFIYSSDDGSELQQFNGTSANVSALYYSQKGDKLAAVGSDIQIWSKKASSYEPESTIPMNASHAVFYDNGSKLLFSKGNDLYKWDLSSNAKIDEMLNGHSHAIGAVNITLDEKYFVTAANDNKINFWDKESFTKIDHFSGIRPDRVQQVAFSKDYKHVFSMTDNSKIQYWELQKAKLDFIIPNLERKSNPSGIDFSADQKFMAVCGTQNKGVEIWDIKKFKPEHFLSHTSFVSKAIFIPNSTKVVGLGRDRKVVIWDMSKPSAAPTKLMGHRSDIFAVASSPDGTVIYTGGKDRYLKVWDVASGTAVNSINVGIEVNTIAVSPDGSQVVLGCGSTTKVFDQQSPTALYVLESGKMADYEKTRDIDGVTNLQGHTASVVEVRYSSDGSKMVSGAADSKIIVWDASSLTQLRKIEGHSSTVNGLNFNHDGNLLVSGSEDATIKFWNLGTGASDFNVVTFNNGNEYITYDANNYYSCTKNGAKNVHFVIDNEVFLFEQFDLRLNRPDLVYANMPGVNPGLLKAYHKAYLKRLKKMNFTEDMLSAEFHIPELTILNEEEIPYQSPLRTVTLKIEAKDDSYLLDRINVWVNDVPLYGKGGINLRSAGVKSVTRDIDIDLSAGKNKIQISVLNQRGAESFKATKFVFYESDSKKNDLYVVGIGVSRFKDSEFNLDYAAKDATDVVSFMKKGGEKFNNIYSKLLLNEEATRSNILALKEFLAGSTIDDNVVLFIASHGLLDDQLDYYLATTDINFYKPSEGGLIYEDLESLLDGIPARKKLLLIDACHSGEVDKDDVYKAPIPPTHSSTEVEETVHESELSATITSVEPSSVKSRGFKKIGGPGLGMGSSFELMKQLFNDLRRGSGATVISSAGGKEFALESGEWNNGVFTFCFLEGLKTMGADLNSDKQINVMEIRNYVGDNVKLMTNGQQNPTFRKENLDNNYAVW